MEKLEKMKEEIRELEKEIEKVTSDVVLKTLNIQLRKMKLTYKKLEKAATKAALSKDILNKDRANAVMNSSKYRKTKQEYQYRIANKIPVNVPNLAKKYNLNADTIYKWVGRYDWKDLEGFVNVRPDMLDMDVEERKKVIKTTLTNKSIVTDTFLSDLAELVKFVDSDGKGLNMKQIAEELTEKGHDISSSYLYKLKQRNLTVYKIFEAGEKIKKVETALYHKAIGGKEFKTRKVKEIMTKDGIEELTEITIEKKDADVSAAKFFLEKRDSKTWGVDKTIVDDKPVININIGAYNED